MLSWGEIKEYRDVSGVSGKQFKVLGTISRRISKGEESAIAMIGLRMASESRRWIPGELHQVSLSSVMNRVFDNPRLMARTIVTSWFKRIGIKTIIRSRNSTAGLWLAVPNSLDDRHPAFGDITAGTCWEILVRPDVMREATKMHNKGKWHHMKEIPIQNPTEGDAVTGRHSILGSPEGHQDLETGEGAMDPSGCLQAATPAQSPPIDAADLQPSMGLEVEMDHVYNVWLENAEMAIKPPWLKPSDPRTIVENLNNIDKLLDEAEQMSQVGYGDPTDDAPEEDPDPAIMPAPERPSGTINVTLVHEGRRIVVPPEARGLDEEDD